MTDNYYRRLLDLDEDEEIEKKVYEIERDPEMDQLSPVFSFNRKIISGVNADELMYKAIQSIMKQFEFHTSCAKQKKFGGTFYSKDKMNRIDAYYIPEERLYAVITDARVPAFRNMKNPIIRKEYYYNALTRVFTVAASMLNIHKMAFRLNLGPLGRVNMQDDFLNKLSMDELLAPVNGDIESYDFFSIHDEESFSKARRIFTGSGEEDTLTIYVPKIRHFVLPVDTDELEDIYDGMAVIIEEEDRSYAEKFAKAMIRSGVIDENSTEDILICYGKETEHFDPTACENPVDAENKLHEILLSHYGMMYEKNMNLEKFMALKEKYDAIREKRQKMMDALKGNEIYEELKAELERQKKAAAAAQEKKEEAEKKIRKLEAEKEKLKEQNDRSIGQINAANIERNKIQKKLDALIREKNAGRETEEKTASSDPTAAEVLQKKLDEKEKELYEARSEADVLRMRLQQAKGENENDAVIVRGKEKDLYDNEIRNVILECLAEAKTDEVALRKNDIINDILEANNYDGRLKKIRKEVRDALCSASSGTEIVDRLEPVLNEINAATALAGKHRKIFYQKDSRYIVITSLTPSDTQATGRNLATIIIKKML